jgi:SAM-dependent methyltransferase
MIEVKKIDIDKYYSAQETRFKKVPEKSGIDRKKSYIKFIMENIDKESVKSVLLVGCGNKNELDIFRTYEIQDVIGVDLNPGDGIFKMDMHDLQELSIYTLPFDLISFSHSFEHSYDPKKVLYEIEPIMNRKGYLCFEIPTNFKTTDIDIYDFGNYKNLYEFINEIFPVEIIKGIDLKHGEKDNFCWGDCSKLIARRK